MLPHALRAAAARPAPIVAATFRSRPSLRLARADLSRRFLSQTNDAAASTPNAAAGSSKSASDATMNGEGQAKDAAADSALEQLKTKLQVKEAEVVDLTSRLRYTQADYQNLQRIAAKEKEQTRDYAITRFATDLLETVDVLNLALRSVPQEYGSAESDGSSRGGGKSAETVLRELVEGVSLTNKQLLSTLGKYGVTAFDPIGERFDPNRHEALYAAPVPGKAAGEVIETQKLGYMIKGRVLRAPQVGIVQEEA